MICKTTVCREVLGPSGELPQSHPFLMYVSGAICVLLFLYILKRIFWLIFGTKGTMSFFGNILKIAVPLCVFFFFLSTFMAQRNSDNIEASLPFIKNPGVRVNEAAIERAETDVSFYENSGVVASHTLLDILNTNFVKRNGGTAVLQINNDPNGNKDFLSGNSTLTFTSAAGKSVTVPVLVVGIQKHGLHPGRGMISDDVLSPGEVKKQTIINPSIAMTFFDGGQVKNDGDYQRVKGIYLTLYYGDVYKDFVDDIANDQVRLVVTPKNLSDLAQVFDNPSDPKIVMR